jgi:VWFA-related protein
VPILDPRRASLALLFILVAANVRATGQAPTSPSSIRVSTRLVQVSAVVHDKHGRPIAGLTKDDFSLFDDNQPQDIASFSVTKNTPPDLVASSDPYTFSNRVGARHDVPPNVAAILLDGLNTQFTDQVYAREQVIKFLLQIQPQDRVALYTLGDDLQILHDFTTDASQLIAALKSQRAFISRTLPDSSADDPFKEYDVGPTARDDMLRDFLNPHPAKQDSQNLLNFLLQDRSEHTLFALLQVAYHLSNLPGRKTLIWVSGSFPLIPTYMFYGLNVPNERLVLSGNVDDAMRNLNNSTIVVYPVDAHGLTTSRGDFNNFVAMNALAEHTGGRAFYNTNDLRGAIRQAIDDSRLTYELSYYPRANNWDGRFHAIRLAVKHPGAHVRTRTGYLAFPQPSSNPPAHEALISQAVTRLVEDNRLAVTVHVAGQSSPPPSRVLQTSIQIDPHQLALKFLDGVWAGTVELLFIQLDREWKVVDTAQQRFLLNLLPPTYENSASQGFTLTREVPIRDRATQLRVVLREPSTGLSGAVAVPLDRLPAN